MEKELTWQAHDHSHTQKGTDWFWVLGILAVSAAVVSILFNNYFFALLILVATTTLAMLAKRTPRTVSFHLTAQGLTAGAEHYTWDVISAFWIEEQPHGDAILLIDTTKALAPHLSIPIPAYRTEEMRTFLSEHVKEEELHEPFSNKIIEFFGL